MQTSHLHGAKLMVLISHASLSLASTTLSRWQNFLTLSGMWGREAVMGRGFFLFCFAFLQMKMRLGLWFVLDIK